MGLAADLAAGPPRRQSRCSTAVIIESLDGDDADALRAALANLEVTSQWIADALRRNGFQTTGQTIGRHRRGMCSCRS